MNSLQSWTGNQPAAFPRELTQGNPTVPVPSLPLDSGSGQGKGQTSFLQKKTCCSPPYPEHPFTHLFIGALSTKLTIIRDSIILACGWIIFNSIWTQHKSRQTLETNAISGKQLIGKDRYLYVIEAAGAGPTWRRMTTSAARGCLHINICPVYKEG